MLQPKPMNATPGFSPVTQPVGASPRNSCAELLAPLDRLAAKSANLVARPIGSFERDGRRYEIPRYVFVGPEGGGTAIPVGVFAAIHGDEPEGVRAVIELVQLLEADPELAAGYCLFFYPICNPTGLEAGTAFSSRGKDLNLELLKISAEPEARLLQAELAAQPLDGIIKLHTNVRSRTFHGLVRNETFVRQLLNPALAAAAATLPAPAAALIDGFRARDVTYDHYEGGLTNPPKLPPRPFEVILEAPGQVPASLRTAALVAVLRTLLLEYRKFIAYAPNL